MMMQRLARTTALRTSALARPAARTLSVGQTLDSKRKVEEDRYIRAAELARAEHHKLHLTDDHPEDKVPLQKLEALIAAKKLPLMDDHAKSIILEWRRTA